MSSSTPLLVGEVFVDVSLASPERPLKMRLGGVVHAARGLWSCDIPYTAAIICPEYLLEEAERYLAAHGCLSFTRLGNVTGAPNVYLISDVTETAAQGYEDLSRDNRTVDILDVDLSCETAIIYPGNYSLNHVLNKLPDTATVVIDVAYSVATIIDVLPKSGHTTHIAISTSSDLFKRLGNSALEPLIAECQFVGAKTLLLKENRGGSRLIDVKTGLIEEIPATLSETENSVGVGDVYTAVFGALLDVGPSDAAWRGAQAATHYSKTTYIDDLKRNVSRGLKLSLATLKGLGGVTLPWHDRREFKIYLAAPDFSYIDKHEVDQAVAALEYHNFRVIRPIAENGEASRDAEVGDLNEFYEKDLRLLDECCLVFAVPLERDPGTLVEIGYAIARATPVVTFDPRGENANTMVMCGSSTYSRNLDLCLNGVFTSISQIRNLRS